MCRGSGLTAHFLFYEVMYMKNEIRTLSLDLETKCSIDIGKCGVYKYVESPDFEILLFGASVNHGPITVYDLACGDKVPEEIIAALSDDRVTKWAYNASFERVCLSVWMRRYYPQHFRTYSIPGDPVQNYLDPSSWKCTLVWAAYNGLPLGSIRSVPSSASKSRN